MKSKPYQNQGFSLLEMLIALAIFSVILLALSFTEFQSAKAITQDFFQESSLVLEHNNYETAFYK